MSMERDYYKVLQVDPAADAEVITAAFRVLARRLHPDRDASGVDEHRMADLNRAYAVLRDPRQRMEYDAQRAQARMAVGPGMASATPTGGLAARLAAATGGGMAQDDAMRLPFGRYAGMSLQEVAREDSDYLRWLARHSSGLRFRSEISRILGERL